MSYRVKELIRLIRSVRYNNYVYCPSIPHRDHLGSVTAVTDASGKLLQQMAYDPFGKRRNTDWQADNAKDDLLYYNSAYLTDIGYTGHDQLDNVGLINMQGRHYNP